MDSAGPNMDEEGKIFGAGEMARLTRAFDWSGTPVGAMAQWPDALLTSVNMILASRNPMLLMWGDDLTQFYNDAFRPSIREDKHPVALGQPGRECWAEAWPIIGLQVEAVMMRGEATWHEDQLVPIHRNGRLEDVYWTYGYSPVRDRSGDIRGTLVVCTETTEVVQAKQQLEQERERLMDLFQQAPAFFAVMTGPEHRFEMINPLYQELIGDRDVVGKPVREAVPEAEGQGFVELLDRVYRTGVPYVGRRIPIQLARSANEPLELHYLDFVYQPRRDAGGAVVGIIALGVDVTEQKRAEQVLVQSEKLNAVGRLASSIAHEINNPLEAVTNLLYLAQMTAQNPDTKLYLGSAEVELRRVAAIANQTLRFYRQSTKARPTTVEEMIDGTLPLYQGRISNHNITVERRDRSRHAVTCFDGEIRQVLSNLVGNAIDAMSGRGGRLLLRARDGMDYKTGRSGVVLTVADTGTGMSVHTRAKIFEPFFTTKGESGTGLGLWISHEIVERHNGVLRVRTMQRPDASGTVFTLFLPCDTEVSER
jgi:signal transduction histidine kinase